MCEDECGHPPGLGRVDLEHPRNLGEENNERLEGKLMANCAWSFMDREGKLKGMQTVSNVYAA